jgi:protein-tyrosine phosphatase
MIDLHCHIVPGVDDGASDINCAREMLRASAEQGVTEIVCSSHAQMEDDGSYDAAFAELEKTASEYSLKLHKGAEYFRKDVLSSDGSVGKFITPNECGFLLLDCGVAHVDNVFISRFIPVFSSGCKIILAHPERLWADHCVETVSRLRESGEMYCQINSGSLLGRYGRKVRRAAWRLLEAGMCHVIASDAHRVSGCTLKECREMLEKLYPAELTERWFVENPRLILAGERPYNCRVNKAGRRFLRWLKTI